MLPSRAEIDALANNVAMVSPSKKKDETDWEKYGDAADAGVKMLNGVLEGDTSDLIEGAADLAGAILPAPAGIIVGTATSVMSMIFGWPEPDEPAVTNEDLLQAFDDGIEQLQDEMEN